MITVFHERKGYRVTIYGKAGQQNYTVYVQKAQTIDTLQKHLEGYPHKAKECPLCKAKEQS